MTSDPALLSQALNSRTALLPSAKLPPIECLPPRFAMSTDGGIQSGILYSALAAVADYSLAFWAEAPEGTVVITGGDAAFLYRALMHRYGMDFRGAGKNWELVEDLTHRGLRDYVTSSQS